jgi:hypothetical protein
MRTLWKNTKKCKAREVERSEKKFAKEDEKFVESGQGCPGRELASLAAARRHGRVCTAREGARYGQGDTQARQALGRGTNKLEEKIKTFKLRW